MGDASAGDCWYCKGNDGLAVDPCKDISSPKVWLLIPVVGAGGGGTAEDGRGCVKERVRRCWDMLLGALADGATEDGRSEVLPELG